MIYIEKTYFNGTTSIPNQDENYQGLDELIKSGTKEIIIEVLGQEIWNDLQTASNYADGTSLHKLLYGTDFTVKGKVHRWNGLINNDKRCFVADYVWLKWSEDNWLLNLGGGAGVITANETELKNQNFRRVVVKQQIEKNIKSLYTWIYYEESFDIDYDYEFKNPVSWLF